MRLFLAIRLSVEMKDALLSVQDRLYELGIRGSFTREENLHLTLAFIGEYPDADTVLDALSAFSFTPFELTLGGLGCFGDLLWAGMKDSVALAAAVRRIRRALSDRDIPFDRKRFTPHITLIRRVTGKIPGIEVPAVSMTVDSVSLMRSDRGRNGMIYTELGTIEAQAL